MSKFKTGDIVIPNSGAFEGTKCKINKHLSKGHYIVESLIPLESRGHQAGGVFDTDRGWGYYERDLELAEPVEDTITIRLLTEQEFKHRGLWSGAFGCPLGWVPVMNKYLEQTINIPLSKIGNDGSFRYEGWDFTKKEYEIVTPSTKNTVTVPQPEVKSEVESKPEPKFQIGDTVIYNGCVSNLKSKIFTVTHIIFGSEIIYSLKAVDSYFHYDIPEFSLEKYNPFESATSVVSTEWIPATKLINSKTKVNLSLELEYHQQPQIIKKPIKKSLITI